jgi:hypothetical protein
MHVLDGSHKPDPPVVQQWQGTCKHLHIKIQRKRFEDHIILRIDRGMPEMDEDIGDANQVKCKITCAVAGVSADENVKPGMAELGCYGMCTPFQAFGKLESDSPRPPSLQCCNQVRGSGQPHAPFR